MAEYLQIEGLADAKRALEALSKDMRQKVVRGALRDAAKPIIRQARAYAPVLTGLVRKRIVASSSKISRRRKGEIGVFIKPRISSKARKLRLKNQDPYYYKWQEEGYQAVGRRSLKNRGKDRELQRAVEASSRGNRYIPGKKFMGRAFDSKKGEALSIFQSAIKKRIDQANRRK